MTVRTSQCFGCVHLATDKERKSAYECKAFPEGIPQKVLSNELDHSKPIEGDNGVQYERDDSKFSEPADEF